MGNPEHKRRSDGRLLGGKDAQRVAKVHKVTGRLDPKAQTPAAAAGAQRLGTGRLWKWMKGED